MKLTPLSRLALAGALCLLPLALLLAGRALQGVDAQTWASTLAGMPLALAGGVLAGLATERLVNRSQNTFQTLLGLALNGGLALLTVGYIYLVHIGGPMRSIGTPGRAVEQTTLFVAFLLAEGAGMLLAPLFLPTRRRSDGEKQREGI